MLEGKAHQKFIDLCAKEDKDLFSEATRRMMQLNYSNLNEKLDENEEEIKKESEMFSSKVEKKYDDEIKEKMGVKYEDHLEEVFDRENYL